MQEHRAAETKLAGAVSPTIAPTPDPRRPPDGPPPSDGPAHSAASRGETSPQYGPHDLRAAEVAGYLRGFHDGRAALDAEAAAQAAVFAQHVRRIFTGSLPFADLQARRDGYDSPRARSARARARRLATDVAASRDRVSA